MKKSLEKFPDLHFKLLDCLVSINSIILYYTSVQGIKAAEFLVFGENGKVIKAIAHYEQIS
ncbi:hypothetical protein C7H19_09025 [Aphanothece hegewaldii CCALA 016]|uniref:SnoaL-like domain-containing protein n=1 Tax=Aphanothece hegewaldii CCALA 016 TaxID=2107694 RepID=A0A2T1LZB7_9CHRO|nr:hypothetical protein [Aphanothece hegewaldii]PSF37686.1 hypothetical protein C7H19_09025 [Aphanothece hegewaldii CCALA 016]